MVFGDLQIALIRAGRYPRTDPKYMSSNLPVPISEHLVDSEELADLIRAAIDEGHAISLFAPGSSMKPFIRSGDKIFISPVDTKSIRIGDILVFMRPSDSRVLVHRAVKIVGDRFLCKGDNVAVQNDGWILFGDLLGRVDRVERDEKPVRLGVRFGKRSIALFSRKNKLVPVINTLRKIKWGFIGLFSSKGKRNSDT